MENLRLLEIRNAYFNKGPSYLPNELQWLNWHKFPSTSLPQDFEGEKLVGLELSRGLISKLWPEDKYRENLKTLNLSGCSKLETLPETLGQLETLEENVKKKEPSFGMSSLSKFTSLPNVKNFIKRSDGERKKPQAARPSLSGLRSLKKLDLSDSDLVDEIAADVWHLTSLEELNLSRNNFVQFPSRISGLPGFKVLKLEECKSLEVLPDLPLSIEVIEANECPALHNLGNLSPQRAFLRKVSFFNCFKLHQQSLKTGICAVDLLLEWLLQDPWTKVRRCCVKVVYKQDLSTLAAERTGINQHSSKELVVYEGGLETKQEGIKEDIAALMAGVTELNWDVDPIEQDSTQLMNLRKSVAYKIQKTLSFEC
ncbi:hypothetical protein K7X08_033553 [Anisodus acutangulus]|uniref:Uncharacterized protein n=1 Tax=Anisodus acutangulus TaxID=402998 RepID=A0A9Q1M4D1_9SOLA|nr:hypothetical protein K7X08_033553 [Anisodus acutangulus]